MNFEDVLAKLCTNIELRLSNDYQQMFVIGDPKEAKLAFDILRSYGVEAKVYHEDNESKLYITNPATNQDELSQKLTHASAYAATLGNIKAQMENFCADYSNLLNAPYYTITFSNNAGGSKQIVVNVLSNASVSEEAPARELPSDSETPRPQQAATSQPKRTGPRYVRPKHEEGLFSGPALLRDNNKIISKKDLAKLDNDTYWRQLTLYIKGNSAVATGIVITVVLILFTIFSMFIVSKGFLCPDLATRKSKEWYCKPLIGRDEAEEEEKKKNIFSDDETKKAKELSQ